MGSMRNIHCIETESPVTKNSEEGYQKFKENIVHYGNCPYMGINFLRDKAFRRSISNTSDNGYHSYNQIHNDFTRESGRKID